MKGFKLICNNCKNEISIEQETIKGEDTTFWFYPIQSTYVNIGCEACDNEIYVEEGR